MPAQLSTDRTTPVAVSQYGRTGASTRVRLYDWLDHLGRRADRFDFLGAADNQPATVLRRLPAALAAQRSLRALPSGLPDRTLLLSRQASPFSNGRLEERLLRSAGRGVPFRPGASLGRPAGDVPA